MRRRLVRCAVVRDACRRLVGCRLTKQTRQASLERTERSSGNI
ncbi:hypothetical protein ACP70R_037948 [Stipagrostis hirtigluma subsp. patula]